MLDVRPIGKALAILPLLGAAGFGADLPQFRDATIAAHIYPELSSTAAQDALQAAVAGGGAWSVDQMRAPTAAPASSRRRAA